MSKARLVIMAVVVEGRRQGEVARAYGVSQGWVSRLVARYRIEGEKAFGPRSRRPKSSPTAIGPSTVELIVELRQKLATTGLDAGPETICWHLAQHYGLAVSRASVARYLLKAGLVTPQPKKRPKASCIRFQAVMPNECWQADFTHYRLSDGSDVEILSWLDDHSRFALSVSAYRRVNGPIVLASFRKTVARYGIPASTLTDNGMVFTTRLSGGTRGAGTRNGLETELRHLGVTQKNSRPNKPTTCGKVERFQQTLKKWLTAQHDQPATITDLQTLINTFVDEYNHHRPHRSLPHHATPATIYHSRPKAAPTSTRDTHTHDKVRHDRVDTSGKITLRYNGQLYHIGIGRTHTRTRVLALVHDLHIRIINTATGELLRELTLNPTKRYQPTGPHPKTE